MAYLDTRNIHVAIEKARNLGATHYFQHVLETGGIFSTHFVKTDQVDDNNNLLEVGHFIGDMKSFCDLERPFPFACVGVKMYSKHYRDSETGKAHYEGCYTRLTKIAPEYKLPPFNTCK